MSQERNSGGGFPQNESRVQDPNSTTGDGHPPRPGEIGSQEGVAGQGLGQSGQSNLGSEAKKGGAGGSSSSAGGQEPGKSSGNKV